MRWSPPLCCPPAAVISAVVCQDLVVDGGGLDAYRWRNWARNNLWTQTEDQINSDVVPVLPVMNTDQNGHHGGLVPAAWLVCGLLWVQE